MKKYELSWIWFCMQSIISDVFPFDFPCFYSNQSVCSVNLTPILCLSLYLNLCLLCLVSSYYCTHSLSCTRFVGELVNGIGGCGVMWHVLFAGVLTAPRIARYKERERERERGESWKTEKERQNRTPNLNGIEWKLRTHAKMWAVGGK